MKYYVQYDAEKHIIALGMTDGDLPEDVTEITETEYIEILDQIHREDEERKEEERRRREEEQRRREEEEAQRRAIIEDYAQRVIDGEITMDDVPDEYWDEVNYIVNPPAPVPTTEELAEQLSATQEALDFILMNMIDEEV